MRMNLSDLLKKNTVRQVEADKKQSLELIAHAEHDLKVAQDNLKINNYDWALAIAYNAMLYAGRSLMAYKGYAPSSDAHHLAVVQFCAVVLPAESGQLASTFNRYRIRRNDVVYGEAESVGEDEAKNSIENSRKFVIAIKERMSR